MGRATPLDTPAMKEIFLNAGNKVRSIWWIPIFFVLLLLFLLPVLFVARTKSVDVPVSLQAIIIILVTLLCQLLRRESITVITGRLDAHWLRQLVAGLLVGAVLMVVPSIILTLSGFARWQVNEMSLSPVLPALAVFVWVAIAEEFLFRGFLFQRLIESLGQWPAQLLIAGMFLLTHMNNPGIFGATKVLAFLNIFIASMMFGLAFIKTGGLAMPLGLHFMANFVQGTVLGFGVSGEQEPGLFKAISENCPDWLNGGGFGLEASLPGLFTVTVITILLYRWKPSEGQFRRAIPDG